MDRKLFTSIKSEVGDAIVLFNVKDYYEAWYEDAPIVAHALDIPTDTTFVVLRSHMLTNLVGLLCTMGYRVAIAEGVPSLPPGTCVTRHVTEDRLAIEGNQT